MVQMNDVSGSISTYLILVLQPMLNILLAEHNGL
jgi:hypothetical protein